MLGLYAMTVKGLAVLRQLLHVHGPGAIAYVVTARDSSTEVDGHDDIVALAGSSGIPMYSRFEQPKERAHWLLAVSWRWLIEAQAGQQLVVFHDSLLPRYRGFAPLVSALVNGDTQVGVTAILADHEYDHGPILAQDAVDLCYPITMEAAIQAVVPSYERLACTVAQQAMAGPLRGAAQDETRATYSLWRDNEDYFVDWSWEAQRIRRFVDAVGHPYRGAAVTVDGKVLRLRACEALPDVVVENRTPGKVIFMREGQPVVVCGQGLLRIQRLCEDGGTDALPLPRFRTRFGPAPTAMSFPLP